MSSTLISFRDPASNVESFVSYIIRETISDSSSADVITNDDDLFEYAGPDAVTREVLLTYPIEESIDYSTSASSGDVSTYDDDMFLYAPKQQE